jgi:hypothetical protein
MAWTPTKVYCAMHIFAHLLLGPILRDLRPARKTAKRRAQRTPFGWFSSGLRSLSIGPAHLLQACRAQSLRARVAPYIGLYHTRQVPRDVVSPRVPQATDPHFPDANMHVLHALLHIVMNLLPYTDRLVSACGPPPDT